MRSMRLQERSHEGTETDKATSGSLDVDGSTGGVSTRARASSSTRGVRASGISTAARCAGASSVGVRVGRRGNKSDGSAIVGADGDSAGGVDHGASAGSSKSEGVDTRANGRDVSRYWLSGDSSGLAGDSVRLSSDGSVSRGHASYDTERVDLGEVGSLGGRVDGG